MPVGILGATGMVGQRLVQLLERHPWFEVAWLGASERSAGQTYAQAARWKLKTPIPAEVAALKVSAPEPEGAGASRAMREAVQRAGLTDADIVHINAHATSTPVGDVAEANAIRRAFGDRKSVV